MSGIFLKTGTVRAQKSSMLINTAHRYEDKGSGVICLKPERDTRDVGIISSKNGLSRPCIMLKDNDSLIEIINRERLKLEEQGKELEVILIDECQFLSMQHCYQILFLSRYHSILLYGLKSDFKGFSWQATDFLSNFAKTHEEIMNPCQYCHSLAKLNLRVDSNGDAVVEGDSVAVDKSQKESDYVPVCPKCYTERTLFKDIFKDMMEER